MSAESKFTASKQNGEPGSCFLAQVFGPSGEAIAQFEPTSPPGTASRYARLLADVLNASQHTDTHALAEDIKASIAELAGGRSFPDLLAAVDVLAGFAVQVETGRAAEGIPIAIRFKLAEIAADCNDSDTCAALDTLLESTSVSEPSKLVSDRV